MNSRISKIVESSLVETRVITDKLDDIITQVQLIDDEKKFMSLASDLECLKSQCLNSSNLIQPWLEMIWSETVLKYCDISMSHGYSIGNNNKF